MIKAHCHCSAIQMTIQQKPKRLTECNCSICRRLGTWWAYYNPGDVEIRASEDDLLTYSRGEKKIQFHTCKRCGCTTHYTQNDKERVAVNARTFELKDSKDIPIRHFDGAVTWKYLD